MGPGHGESSHLWHAAVGRNFYGGDVATSRHDEHGTRDAGRDETVNRSQIREAACNDPRDARFQELNAIGGLDSVARRIHRCGAWSCNHRLCPVCAARQHKHYRERLRDAVDQMTRPTLMIFKVYAKGLGAKALRTALHRLRSGLSKLRRSTAFREVRACVGMVEIARVGLGGADVWNAHAHVIVDAPYDALEVPAIRSAWRRVTGAESSSIGKQAIQFKAAIIAYLSKLRDRCPPPGTTDPIWLLKVICQALKGRQLFVGWGVDTTQRGRVGAQRRRRARAPMPPVSLFVPTGGVGSDDPEDPFLPLAWVFTVRRRPRG
jgi:hypothetical protein